MQTSVYSNTDSNDLRLQTLWVSHSQKVNEYKPETAVID